MVVTIAACGASSKEARDPASGVSSGTPEGAATREPAVGGNSAAANASSGASTEVSSTRGTKGKTSVTDETEGLSSNIGGGRSACGCVRARVAWGLDGGLTPFRATQALEGCATFRHERSTMGRAPLSCRQDLDSCSSEFAAIAALLLRPDVLMVSTLAPVFYGEDTRAADGQVLRIDIGGALIEVGEPCRSAACKPIPAGIATLGTALLALSKRELARGACSEVFPSE